MKFLKLFVFLLLTLFSYNRKLKQSENYFIRFKAGNQCLDVFQNQKYGNYINWTCQNSLNQTWRLRKNNDGSFTFLSNLHNQVMDVEGQSTYDGAQIKNFDENNGYNQKFIIEKTQDCRYYYIKNMASGKCITSENPYQDGANIKQWTCNENSLVYFQSPFNTDAFPVGGNCNTQAPVQQDQFYFSQFTNYFVRLKGTDLCLDIFEMQKDGNYITWPCTGSNNQSWRLHFNPDDGTYTFLSNLHGGVMDVERESTNDGAQIKNYQYHGRDNQRFYLEVSEDCRYYRIKNKISRKCIAPSNPFLVGSNIKLSPCNENSLFYFQSPLEVDVKGYCNIPREAYTAETNLLYYLPDIKGEY